MIRAFAADGPGTRLEPFEIETGPLGEDQVEIAVRWCGICHSDISVLDNEWGMTQYPLVPGHEVVGTVSALGSHVRHLEVGQTVGLGWFSGSCMRCRQCMSGDHNLCGDIESTILGRYGGFAERVRCSSEWAIPLPEGVDARSAGPLFCGGITVFNPIVEFDVQPTDRVGVIGIGGLGHLALQFLSAWGCHVTAFTSSEDKGAEARRLGADDLLDSRDPEALDAVAGSFDLILSTVNVPLDWERYLGALGPKGRLHLVGAVLEPIPVAAFSLIGGQHSISGTGLGSPANTARMLDFCARHGIAPQIEVFPMTSVNEAVDHLRSGRARFRVVLESDF